MVNATNESWFGTTAAAYQLLAINTFRSVENRVSIARVGNTGITAFIDPYGRIIQRLRNGVRQELFVEGILLGQVPLAEGQTFYTRYGDAFAALQIILCVQLLAYAFVRRTHVHEAREFQPQPCGRTFGGEET